MHICAPPLSLGRGLLLRLGPHCATMCRLNTGGVSTSPPQKGLLQPSPEDRHMPSLKLADSSYIPPILKAGRSAGRRGTSLFFSF